jgi:transposase
LGQDVKMGVHLDASLPGGVSRLEVIDGPTGRRRRSRAERAQIAAESMMPGVRVADVARKHGTTRWQIYDWRKQIRSGKLVLPERLAALPSFAALVVEPPREPEPAASAAGVELVMDGIVIRADADADEEHLARVIRAVRAAGR